MSHKWFRTGYFKSAPSGAVDREKGIIHGVAVCSEGEAKGHGVHLDSEFISDVVDGGNAKDRQGLKARFGHPTMCSESLGTFIGRFKNFSVDGEIARADLYLSNSAKDAPGGDLYEYMLTMAEDEPDMFGTSIVFTPGKFYRRNEDGDKVYGYTKTGEWNEVYDETEGPEFIEMAELHGCDAVDEPAANEGLFSGETIAGQITHFLQDNPDIIQRLSDSPEVLKALADHGDQAGEFISKFQQQYAVETITQPPKKGEDPMAENQATEEETASTAEPNTDASTESEATNAEPTGSNEPETDEADTGFNAYRKCIKEFGQELTEKHFDDGGYDAVQKAAFASFKAENEALKAKVAANEKGAPAGKFSEGKEGDGKPTSFKALFEQKLQKGA